MIEALMLKLAALSLLALLAQSPGLPEDFRSQAQAVAIQALAASDTILSASSTNTVPSAPAPATPSPAAPTAAAPVTTENTNINNTPPPMPQSQARIEIISPIPGKGLGREYRMNTGPLDEANYIELGAVVYDDAGAPTNQPTVVITATDQGQGKTLTGTGNVTPIYVNGEKRVVPVYAYHYEFHSAGEHTITFASGNLTESVTVTVGQ